MLYVFLVNTGTTLMFDMQLAMQTVDVLKKKIAEHLRIPPDKQVLLISGGEWLEVTARVGSYTAGTDTCPIFLFSKVADIPQLPADTMQASDELDDQVSGSLSLPPSYSTVVARSQLAQQIFEQGKEQVRQCDQLIHEQHLQQQGWSAVVANMDDLSSILDVAGSRFSQQYAEYLQEREEHFALLNAFPEDVQLLARIPLLEPLTDGADGASNGADGAGSGADGADGAGSGAIDTDGAGSEAADPQPQHGASLLDWISAQDSNRLEEMCDRAQQGLQLMDEPFLAEVVAEQRQVLDPAMAADMSEIRGLEERLTRLDELRHRAQTLVAEQKELAKAFIQNQARASCVNDASVLPDLCASHCTQLQVMLEKHRQLVEARKRCAKAKEELSTNIQTRLSWIVSIQRRMTELSNKLMIYSERLKQLRQQMGVLRALHQAPGVYLQAVTEVVRRRRFTRQFLAWAGRISSGASAVHAAETEHRRRFAAHIDAHFLKAMFPGVEQAPPPFAVSCPPDYDAPLPPLTAEHVQQLRAAIPELQQHLQLPPTPPLPPEAAAGAEETGGARAAEAAACTALRSRLPQVRADVRRLGREVAAAVEQYGHELSADGRRLMTAIGGAADAEQRTTAELQQQLQSCRAEVAALEARLATELAAAAEQQRRAVQALTLEHTVEMERAHEQTTRLQQQLEAGADRQRIVGILEASFQERERKAVEACAERLRAEQEAERRQLRDQHADQLHRQAEEQRARLVLEWREVGEKQRREQDERHQRQLQQLTASNERQCCQLAAEAAAERRAAVAAAGEQLRAQHRAEVQALRARFRMMTSNLGSPSDGSSEHLPVGSPPSEPPPSTDGAPCAARRPPPGDGGDSPLQLLRVARAELAALEPAAAAQRAADRLADCEQRLLQQLQQQPEPTAAAPEPDEAAASVRRLQRDNERLRMQLSRSTSGLLERGQVSVLSCNDGDAVLLVWDAERRHFRVFQDTAVLYFVHSESLPALGLSAPPAPADAAARHYAVAEVVSHEYCQAKKEGNRYRVPRGTRFYRVRVKPWSRAGAAASEPPAPVRRLSVRSSSVESHETAP